MNDRELLALAAKAAGVEIEWEHDKYPRIKGQKRYWGPLTDDGDALRLVVKCRIDNRQFMQDKGRVDCLIDRLGRGFVETVGADPYEATRRAIVRAAAEVGKGMSDAE